MVYTDSRVVSKYNRHHRSIGIQEIIPRSVDTKFSVNNNRATLVRKYMY